VLEGYFLSAYSARKLGLRTTGNAGGSYNLILLDRVRRAHTKALRGWIQFRGPVHAPGKVAEFRPGESRLWDLPAVLEVLQEHGIQPGEVLNVDARRIKKLSKEARRALDQHVTKGVKEKFGVYSTEGDDEEENGGGE